MKKLALLAFLAAGCWGYEEMDNQMSGQVKKVHHVTPLVCPAFSTVDVSLGTMRNGVGSMSDHDITMTIWNKADEDVLEQAAREGAIVDIKYSRWRMAWCREDAVVQHVQLVK